MCGEVDAVAHDMRHVLTNPIHRTVDPPCGAVALIQGPQPLGAVPVEVQNTVDVEHEIEPGFDG